ncbi:MAG: TIGR00269 family protein, partial [Thermoplasmata archaeon]|nr:TIGR00269 family protein [Thermoplasmata archaeon]
LVPRMIPLRIVPESEIKLFANVMEIPYLDMHCPSRPRAHRLGFLEVINQMEKETPGTRHSIISSYDQMIEPLRVHFPPAELNNCSKCEEPTMGEICKACELLEKVKEALEKT